MKNLILTLLLVVISSTILTANEQDTLWLRTTTSGVIDLDFTPDDKYVIAWTNSIEFWNVETATMDYILPNIKVGGMSPDEKHLVFIQDGVPKMLDIETKEIIGGFEPPTFKPNHVKVGNDNNIFMCFNERDSLFIWDIETKQKEKVFSIETDFIEKGEEFEREITDYGFAGNNDDFLFVSIREQNKYAVGHPSRILRRFSLFYNRSDFTLFDSLLWIGNYKTMNLNKDIIAIDKYDGTIELYNVREKLIKNSIKHSDIKLPLDDIEFSTDDEILGLTRGYTSTKTLKLFKLTDNNLILDFKNKYYTWNHFKISNNQQKFIATTGSSLYMYSNQWEQTDVENNNTENDLLISPTPSIEYIQISYDFPQISSYKFSLYDILGNLITFIDDGYSSSMSYSKEYNISSLPSGAYFIRLEYEGAVVNKQFIKE